MFPKYHFPRESPASTPEWNEAGYFSGKINPNFFGQTKHFGVSSDRSTLTLKSDNLPNVIVKELMDHAMDFRASVSRGHRVSVGKKLLPTRIPPVLFIV